MKQKIRSVGIFRRLQALFLAVGTLWTVSVTAGSRNIATAAAALREELPLRLLQWEIGGWQRQDMLSAAAMLALQEAPILLSAREDIEELWEQAEEPEIYERLELVPVVPVEESPIDIEPMQDNGVPAKTLVPTDPGGYTVCGKTFISNTTEHTLSVDSLQESFAAELVDAEGPQILIVHTHGSEAYTPAEKAGVVWSGEHRTTDSRYNVVKAGDEMAKVFGEAGISVLHDRTLYDYPNYSGAYDRSLAAIQSYLAQYPSIRFVLDVHRDAVEDAQGMQYKVVAPTGESGLAAQLSLVIGSDGGGQPHPDWMENLKLAAAIQEEILAEYPSLMRPVLLRNSRYNQHATTGSLLVEVGAAGNSPEEAVLAARIFAENMVDVLMIHKK